LSITRLLFLYSSLRLAGTFSYIALCFSFFFNLFLVYRHVYSSTVYVLVRPPYVCLHLIQPLSTILSFVQEVAPKLSDTYCFEMLSMVLALSGSKVGRAYLSQQYPLLKVIRRIFGSHLFFPQFCQCGTIFVLRFEFREELAPKFRIRR
jgi:hypothetical protein